ncbi:hypothetical protein LTR36_003427 [Oleoguttula mirabilis]|uniref:Uncharacterized protein n=1 Tax=Oleoguttula mirabilis TaxID=1507867 RepID=A0AAV9JL69_9PEZI|nr:hypothetical protein LTR36_003427 [Oleoguttula mirabilis]
MLQMEMIAACPVTLGLKLTTSTQRQWDKLEHIHDTLQPFYDVTVLAEVNDGILSDHVQKLG